MKFGLRCFRVERIICTRFGEEQGGARPVLLSALKACSVTKELEWGKRLHTGGYDTSMAVTNCLINMYMKCGSFIQAQRTFDEMPERDVISWTTLIMGYVNNGEEETALELFTRMEAASSCSPNSETFVAALKACSALASKQPPGTLVCLAKGMEIHSRAGKLGYVSDIFVTGALMDMYSNCRSTLDCRTVFDKAASHNVVVWNTLIAGYAENGEAELALDLFASMRSAGCEPNYRSFVASLKACALLATREEAEDCDGRLLKPRALRKGQEIHSQATKLGFNTDVYVANTLVDMYSKCGDVTCAREVFDRIASRSVVSWGALMLGYAENGKPELAMETLSRMRAAAFTPSALTFQAALKACSSWVSLHLVRAIHTELCRHGFLHGDDSSSSLETSLMDAYGKCGSTPSAQQLFDSLGVRDVVSWNSLMTGYGRQGETREVFETLERMLDEGGGVLRPNQVTFLCLLSACSHAGLVNKGKELFQSMSRVFGIPPSIEHYHCLVDMLGRANRLCDALEVVKTMPYKPNAVTWRTLLSSSKKWRNDSIARLVFDKVMEVSHTDPTVYLLFHGCL